MKPSLVRVVLISLLLAVQLATVVIVVMGMRNQTNDHIGEVARQGLGQFNQQVSQRVTRLTADATQAVENGTALIASGVLDARNNDTIARFLMVQMQTFPDLARMQLVRDDGSLVRVERQAEGFRSQTITVPTSDQPGEREVRFTEVDPATGAGATVG